MMQGVWDDSDQRAKPWRGSADAQRAGKVIGGGEGLQMNHARAQKNATSFARACAHARGNLLRAPAGAAWRRGEADGTYEVSACYVIA